MDVKLCKRVSKFKMSDYKAGSWASSKPLNFCPDYLTNHLRGICYFHMIDIDKEFCKKV